MEPRSPALQVNSLPAEPQRKPKNTGLGSLSLLQGIFPTQGSNRGLLHCRQILYQLSQQGSQFFRPEYWSGCPFPSPRSSQSRDRTQVSALQADSLSAQPQGNPKNTGVGSLSFLQWTVPTQGLNRGLLHCRQILYHLSQKGSPRILEYQVVYPFSR